MTAKSTKSVFFCRECGASSPKWLGKCPTCGEWSSLVEQPGAARKSQSGVVSASSGGVRQKLGAVQTDLAPRSQSGLAELDRILGGGLVKGSVILVGGEPGIGKSTLFLQALAGYSNQGLSTLYVTAEESAAQLALRAGRLAGGAPTEVEILATTVLEDVDRAVSENLPAVLIVDSVQTLRSESLESMAGSVAQLREVTARLVDMAKTRDVSIFLIGHVTKDGALAGPKLLEHLVDTVLSFEGHRSHNYRMLRVLKNRFGAAGEMAVYEMSAQGLIEVPDPSALFLAERSQDSVGAVVVPTAEGSRPLLMEVQALLVPAAYGSVRRIANGLDANRLAILLAVLERKAGVQVLDQDVFASVVGGARIDETALDLGLCAAVVSSLRNRPLPHDTVVFGELGLTGELRGVPRPAQRLIAAQQQGFRRAILPMSTSQALAQDSSITMQLVGASTLLDALEQLFV